MSTVVCLNLLHNWSEGPVYLVFHFKLVIKANHEIAVEVTFKKKKKFNSLSLFFKGAFAIFSIGGFNEFLNMGFGFIS